MSGNLDASRAWVFPSVQSTPQLKSNAAVRSVRDAMQICKPILSLNTLPAARFHGSAMFWYSHLLLLDVSCSIHDIDTTMPAECSHST